MKTKDNTARWHLISPVSGNWVLFGDHNLFRLHDILYI